MKIKWVRLALVVAVAAIIPACTVNSDVTVSDIPGEFRILALGGTGTAGNGGTGGTFTAWGDQVGGDVKILSTGSVNAGMDIPNVMPFLGDNPKTVSANTTLTGQLQSYYPFPGDDGLNDASGLWVKPGVTLTLQPNFDLNYNNPYVYNKVYLYFQYGVYIEGTVVIAPKIGSTHTSDAEFDCESFVIAPTGSLVVAGADANPGQGRNAGNCSILAYGTIVNLGLIDGRGGNGSTNGGSGLSVYLSTYNTQFSKGGPIPDRGFGIYNGGSIYTDGGNGGVGFGGNAGTITFNAYNGAHNTGLVRAHGGTGPGFGGSGGDIGYYSEYVGALTSSGTIDSSGGDSSSHGNGGAAGEFYASGNSGSARIAGRILCHGGNGGPSNGNGGAGNRCWVYVDQTSSAVNSYNFSEGLSVGADIDASGGTGRFGGYAGYVYFENYSYGYPRPVGVTLVGYQEINVSGGDGSIDGGSADGFGGGNFLIQPDIFGGPPNAIVGHPAYDNQSGRTFGGTVYNEVPFLATGGNGGSGSGGSGASLDFSYRPYGFGGGEEFVVPSGGGGWSNNLYPDQGVKNVAPISLYGGSGAVSGGQGGSVDFYYDADDGKGSLADLRNDGTIDTHGGSGGAGYGGDAGYINFYQPSTNDTALFQSGIVNTGALLAYGGNGGQGGHGNSLSMRSDYWLTNTGSANLNGGAGSVGNGGDGGYAALYATTNHTALIDLMVLTNSGSIACAGGTGATYGGSGNYAELYSSGNLTNTGSISLSGGNGVIGGGYTYYLTLESEGRLVNAANIIAYGGSTTYGDAGGTSTFNIYAHQVICSGAIINHGGNSTFGAGGYGNNIQIYSTEGGSVLGGTSLDARGGTTGGGDGTLYVDGVALGTPTAGF